MKTKFFIFLVALLAIQFPACLPEDEDPEPGDPVTKFLGDWKVDETCNRLNYNVQIEKDPLNSSQVLIYNFGNPGPGYDPAVGLVVSSNIYVSSQIIGTGWTVSGTGTYLSNGTIDWEYSLVIPPSEYNCTAIFSR